MTHDDLSSVDITLLTANRNWQAQYRVLMQWAQLIQPKAQIRSTENKIRGCAAEAWLSLAGDTFQFDSDSRIICGFAALLISLHERGLGEPIKVAHWQDLLQQLGLYRQLSPSRNNGVHALMQRMADLWNHSSRFEDQKI